jgi:hypothetical protein
MIRAEQIPDEVVASAAEEIFAADGTGVRWQDVSELTRRIYMDLARRAIVAALNAWPGVDCRPTFGPSRIILPLPQKEGDA